MSRGLSRGSPYGSHAFGGTVLALSLFAPSPSVRPEPSPHHPSASLKAVSDASTLYRRRGGVRRVSLRGQEELTRANAQGSRPRQLVTSGDA
jgi:hypothetical protein